MAGGILKCTVFLFLSIGYVLPVSKFKRLPGYKTKIPSSVILALIHTVLQALTFSGWCAVKKLQFCSTWGET